MRECNETVTVLNRRYDSAAGRDVWQATVITGVSWHSTIAASVTSAGLKTAKTATVRIPVDADTHGATYTDPAEYNALQDTSGAYTLARGDVIVRGTVSLTPPSGATESLTPADIQRTHEDYITIIGVTDDTRRPHGAHRKVVGQ